MAHQGLCHSRCVATYIDLNAHLMYRLHGVGFISSEGQRKRGASLTRRELMNGALTKCRYRLFDKC
jgi:hypothetical protein